MSGRSKHRIARNILAQYNKNSQRLFYTARIDPRTKETNKKEKLHGCSAR